MQYALFGKTLRWKWEYGLNFDNFNFNPATENCCLKKHIIKTGYNHNHTLSPSPLGLKTCPFFLWNSSSLHNWIEYFGRFWRSEYEQIQCTLQTTNDRYNIQRERHNEEKTGFLGSKKRWVALSPGRTGVDRQNIWA
jgi:hypothetical protein